MICTMCALVKERTYHGYANQNFCKECWQSMTNG